MWKSTYLRKFLSLDLANWSIYMKTRELYCLKTANIPDIMWNSMTFFLSILPNAKNFPDIF